MNQSVVQSDGARRRSDGERTHSAILEVATQLASVYGLQGLTIGGLAKELGVSKSGVYAHFGSKLELQLETIEAAREIFEREVLAPAQAAPAGIAQLEALCEAFLSYIERGVFMGGCFFAAMFAELDGSSGRLNEIAADAAREWMGAIEGLAEEAVHRGDLAPETDIGQLSFELNACLDLANSYHALLGDPSHIDRARRAIAATLSRARS